MLKESNQTREKKQIYILIFIHQIAKKTMTDLVFFLKKNNFSCKRLTVNKFSEHYPFPYAGRNSNFILESTCEINTQELKNVVFFLNQYTSINTILFKNQVLNFERITSFEEQPKFQFWKQINNWII